MAVLAFDASGRPHDAAHARDRATRPRGKVVRFIRVPSDECMKHSLCVCARVFSFPLACTDLRKDRERERASSGEVESGLSERTRARARQQTLLTMLEHKPPTCNKSGKLGRLGKLLIDLV